MSKGEHTRQSIIEQAAPIFNVRGYAGTSMDDIVKATGLSKGGIFNHFGNKDALALAAFDYSVSLMRERFRVLVAGKRTTRSRLEAMMLLFQSLIETPPVDGGCPVLNTAIEADDTHPALRELALQVCEDWRDFIVRTVRKGIELGNVLPDTDPEGVSSLMMAALEGGVMVSKLYNDANHIRRAVAHLTAYLDTFIQKSESEENSS
jgi:TetR/AcrR family transcriptional regulator, transcriptional repressor for nem operon